jgi:hypothetical protein
MTRVRLGGVDFVATGSNPAAQICFLEAVVLFVPEALRALAALDPADALQLHAWARQWHDAPSARSAEQFAAPSFCPCGAAVAESDGAHEGDVQHPVSAAARRCGTKDCPAPAVDPTLGARQRISARSGSGRGAAKSARDSCA